MSDEEVKISLTKNEAIVLFNFVSRFSDTQKLVIEDQAEERALWNLTCMFEKELAEPFAENYSEILEQAKNNLRDEEE